MNVKDNWIKLKDKFYLLFHNGNIPRIQYIEDNNINQIDDNNYTHVFIIYLVNYTQK